MTFFNEQFRHLKLENREEMTASEVRFLTSLVPRGSRYLDLGCGTGRHAIAMASEGHRVVGVERELSYVERARNDIIDLGLTESCTVLNDEFPCTVGDNFDLVALMFQTFGYGSDSDNEATLGWVQQVLAPNGIAVLDLLNRDWRVTRPKESRIKRHPPKGDDRHIVLKEYDFDSLASTEHIRFTYLMNGAVIGDVTLSVRLYSLHEIVELGRRCGLQYIGAYSDFERSSFLIDDKHLIVVFRKRPAMPISNVN